ncbi:MAG TPA: hypothetical protein VFZ59_03485, partial [Verrucomicrobiae bacterium]|nr:hypothetical protein [Verrucomicrobiae bacterium]
TAFWVCISLPAQKEQHRFVTHAALLENKDYAGALEYLARHQPSDFPPSRRLEPNPYEYRVWHDLPPTVALLNSNTPAWIRERYLSHLTVTLSHYFTRYESFDDVAAMLSAMHKLPEGREWMLQHQVALTKVTTLHTANAASPAKSNILEILRSVGVAETNLDTLSK